MEQLDPVKIKKRVDRWGYLFGILLQVVMLVDGILLVRSIHPQPAGQPMRIAVFFFTAMVVPVLLCGKYVFKQILLRPKSLVRKSKGKTSAIVKQITMCYVCVFACSNAPVCYGAIIFISGAGPFGWWVGLGAVSVLSFFWLRPSRKEIETLVGEINLELRQAANP
jgi:hypothetical protein